MEEYRFEVPNLIDGLTNYLLIDTDIADIIGSLTFNTIINAEKHK